MRALLLALIVFAAPSIAHARQYRVGGNVVHTRRAPVIMHRLVPPYAGVHVYQGEVQSPVRR